MVTRSQDRAAFGRLTRAKLFPAGEAGGEQRPFAKMMQGKTSIQNGAWASLSAFLTTHFCSRSRRRNSLLYAAFRSRCSSL